MLDKEKIRNEKIDNLATKIMTEEALKIITEAYEVVFEAKEVEKSMEEELQDNEDTICHEADTGTCNKNVVTLTEQDDKLRTEDDTNV